MCLFCLRQACEFETQAHALSFLCGPSHLGGGYCTCTTASRAAFTFIPCRLARSQISCLTTAHFLARPAHRLRSLSSLCVSFLQTHLCVSLSSSHSYDLGVRVAPTPSPGLDRVTLPLLSRSPCEGAPCQAKWSLPACSLPASSDLWTSRVRPQTPLVSGVSPAMAQTAWKIVQTGEWRGAGLL